MSKTIKEESVATLKIQAVKVHYRYLLALVALVALIGGTVFGYFLAVDLTTDAQAKVVNSIELSVKNQE